LTLCVGQEPVRTQPDRFSTLPGFELRGRRKERPFQFGVLTKLLESVHGCKGAGFHPIRKIGRSITVTPGLTSKLPRPRPKELV
jgi:hypothetical protein